MPNVFKFDCEICGEAIFSTSVKEGEEKLEQHECSFPQDMGISGVDYINMPLDEFVALIKFRLEKVNNNFWG